MNAFRIFFIGLVLLGSRVFAEDGTCSTQDFNAELGDPYVQGDTAWCAAHSAAAVLSQAVHKRVAPGVLASLAVTATSEELDQLESPELRSYVTENKLKDKIIYPDERDQLISNQVFQFTTEKDADGDLHLQTHGFMDLGGREDLAIIEADLNGFCTTDQMPDGDHYLEYLKELQAQYKQNAHAKKSTSCKGNCHHSSKSKRKDSLDFVRTVIRDWVKTHCQTLQKLETPLAPKLLALVDDKGMATQIHFHRVYKDEAYRQWSQHILFKEIDGNFDRKRISAIGYDSCEHGAPDLTTGECTSKTRYGLPGNPHQEHSAIISARKMIQGQCRYFIRNHYGKTCNIYKPNFASEDVCDINYGGIWVTRDQLKTIYSVFSVK
jgi:hypothetical protein